MFLLEMTGVRKAVIAVLVPTGLVWLLLCGCCVFCWWRRQQRFATLLTLLVVIYGLGGNDRFATWLIGTLERDCYELDYTARDAAIEPFDALLVLGGGVSARRCGAAMADQAGDRVLLAARLYHRGLVQRLITSGSPAGAVSTTSSASLTTRIWTDLNIPTGDIVQISGTRTVEEMRALRELMPAVERRGLRVESLWDLDGDGEVRVGVVTSAWHMPRALRLARAEGLELVPVPAHFLSDGSPVPWVLAYLPSADAFKKTQWAMVEYLARLAGQ